MKTQARRQAGGPTFPDPPRRAGQGVGPSNPNRNEGRKKEADGAGGAGEAQRGAAKLKHPSRLEKSLGLGSRQKPRLTLQPIRKPKPRSSNIDSRRKTATNRPRAKRLRLAALRPWERRKRRLASAQLRPNRPACPVFAQAGLQKRPIIAKGKKSNSLEKSAPKPRSFPLAPLPASGSPQARPSRRPGATCGLESLFGKRCFGKKKKKRKERKKRRRE